MAPRTRIAIIYEIYTGTVRRIIVPGDHDNLGVSEDQQLATHTRTCSFDEKIIIERYTGSIDHSSINAIIQRHTGMILK